MRKQVQFHYRGKLLSGLLVRTKRSGIATIELTGAAALSVDPYNGGDVLVDVPVMAIESIGDQ